MAERIRIDHGDFQSAKARILEWRIPAAEKARIHRFLDDLGLGKVNRGKRISPQRQLKYLYALRAPLEFFNKTSDKLIARDIEGFERALATGRIANHFSGRPLAHNTQVDMRLLLKVYLRWGLGVAKAEALTGWLDVRARSKTPDFLKEAEVEKLYKHCRNAAQRFLVAVLFDAGMRAEEFHNIRYEDVQMPEGKDPFVRITLKEEYSKTLGRNVALFWKYSLDAVKEFLEERIAEGIKPADPVFPGTYDATKKLLQRFGQKVLKRPVHYHLFRHSSATYYANKLNRQELCLRYGWKFSSNMPDVYISRAGVESKALETKFAQTELSALKDDNAKLQAEVRMNQERFAQLEASVLRLTENLDLVERALRVSSDPVLLRRVIEARTTRR